MRLTKIRWAALMAIMVATSGCGKPATLADMGLPGSSADDPSILENDVYITFTGRAPRVAVITVQIGDNNVATVQIGNGNTAINQSGGTGNIVQVGVVNAANSVNGSTGAVVATNTQLVVPLSGSSERSYLDERPASSPKSRERSRRGDEGREI